MAVEKKTTSDDEVKLKYVAHFPSGREQEGERQDLPDKLRLTVPQNEGGGGITLRKSAQVSEDGVTHYYF